MVGSRRGVPYPLQSSEVGDLLPVALDLLLQSSNNFCERRRPRASQQVVMIPGSDRW